MSLIARCFVPNSRNKPELTAEQTSLSSVNPYLPEWGTLLWEVGQHLIFERIPPSLSLTCFSIISFLWAQVSSPLPDSTPYISGPFCLPVVSYGFQTFPLSSVHPLLFDVRSCCSADHNKHKDPDHPSSFICSLARSVFSSFHSTFMFFLHAVSFQMLNLKSTPCWLYKHSVQSERLALLPHRNMVPGGLSLWSLHALAVPVRVLSGYSPLPTGLNVNQVEHAVNTTLSMFVVSMITCYRRFAKMMSHSLDGMLQLRCGTVRRCARRANIQHMMMYRSRWGLVLHGHKGYCYPAS